MISQVALLYIPESPKYLYSKGKFQEAKGVLKYIRSFNKTESHLIEFKFDKELQNEVATEIL
jgi:hypothetical protein